MLALVIIIIICYICSVYNLVCREYASYISCLICVAFDVSMASDTLPSSNRSFGALPYQSITICSIVKANSLLLSIHVCPCVKFMWNYPNFRKAKLNSIQILWLIGETSALPGRQYEPNCSVVLGHSLNVHDPADTPEPAGTSSQQQQSI